MVVWGRSESSQSHSRLNELGRQRAYEWLRVVCSALPWRLFTAIDIPVGEEPEAGEHVEAGHWDLEQMALNFLQ